jgi:hypothetical protein
MQMGQFPSVNKMQDPKMKQESIIKLKPIQKPENSNVNNAWIIYVVHEMRDHQFTRCDHLNFQRISI